MKKRHLLTLGLLVFLFAALFNLPARQLQQWVAEDLENAQIGIYGTQGTASVGHVQAIEHRGRSVIGDLDWQMKKLQLLLGRLSFHLSGGRDGVLVDGEVFALPSGTLALSDFRIGAPVKHLLTVSGLKFAPLGGQINANLKRLKVRDQWPTQVEGTLIIQGLALELGREPVLFGDFQAVMEPDTGGNSAVLSSLSGPVELEGNARITDDRKYEADLRLKAKPDAPKIVGNYLKNLGRPDGQGWYQISYKGSVQAPTRPETAPDKIAETPSPKTPHKAVEQPRPASGVSAGPLPPEGYE